MKKTNKQTNLFCNQSDGIKSNYFQIAPQKWAAFDMSRFGSGAVLELGHFITGPFWKWAVLTLILVSQYGFIFFLNKTIYRSLCFFPDNKYY